MFLIAHAGPWLTVLGAMITSECVVQRLTDFIWIPVHSVCDDEQYFRVARVLFALRESLDRLDEWYKTVLKTEPAGPSSSRFFPTPDTYLQDDGKPVKFTYLKPLERSTSCVTYLAKTCEAEGNLIVVKFVTAYGADAHRAMASAGFAPKLLYHGEINIEDDAPSYGELRMVVMEYCKGITLHDAMQLKKRLPRFADSLREAIAYLHHQNFVFGDLREPNIMVSEEGKVNLVDFNWAGRKGKATYPPSISPTIPWAPGVGPLEPITKEHDMRMVELVETKYKNCCSM